tara:strand:+ start:207 stop:491 length:285 start_codon:yes stop_codon:yes gene_type:complete
MAFRRKTSGAVFKGKFYAMSWAMRVQRAITQMDGLDKFGLKAAHSYIFWMNKLDLLTCHVVRPRERAQAFSTLQWLQQEPVVFCFLATLWRMIG